MIESFRLKFGKGPGISVEDISATPVTVFVGPNNSGKSRVLAELHYFCSSGQQLPGSVILESIKFDEYAEDVVEKKIKNVTLKTVKEKEELDDILTVGKRNIKSDVRRRNLLNALRDPNSNSINFCEHYLRYNVLKLDGQGRINLINNQGFGDLQQPPENFFQVLFRDDDLRMEVRRIIFEAFNSYLVIDPGMGGSLRLRLSQRPPKSHEEERGWNDESIKFHSEALPIEQTSDGIKAFTGMITAIFAGDPAVLIIDEPEAFLHPPLSYKLGNEVAKASLKSEKRLFVSTHSSNFVMGCIQSGVPVNIIRLTYREGVATARLLPNEDILRLMRNPLLRSTGVLSGLFYESVIVGEADADRAFYQEINERLLRYKPEWGISNCLFINAQNKQTVKTIIQPLRDLGIPAAGIVDIDVLKEGGSNWTSFLEAAGVPPIDCLSLSTGRAQVMNCFKEIGKDMKREGGIQLLAPSAREAAENLLGKLVEYGLFVIPNGELETWLKSLNVSGKGPNWLIAIFEKIGENPEDGSYLKPSEGDVWEFLRKIKSWMNDPNRKGIPT
ncbi:MAG: ATP-binding protein [Nitrospirales bacterium]